MRMRVGALRALLLLPVLLFFPGAASAQLLAGSLVDPADRSIGEALVTLVDSAGREVARGTVAPSGGFRLAAPAAGEYRVRVFRIGHTPWTSEPATLAAGDVQRRRLVVPALPVELPALVATEPGRCAGAAGGSAAAVLLEEARKALSLAHDAGPRGTSFTVATFDITLDPEFRVIDERAVQRTSSRDLPIVSTTVDTLRRFGFVREVPAYDPNGPMYYGPDDAVLLSDWFLTTHCFSVTGSGDSIVAVGFEPAERRGLADIVGTMRFARDPLMLRSLEFTYVRLPAWVPERSAGGAVEFDRIAGAGLVATQWWMRAPIAEVSPYRSSPRLHGYREAGGVVVGVERDGQTVSREASDSLLRRSPIAAETGQKGSAEAPPPILLQQPVPGMSGRRILARNEGTQVVTITELRVRECFNIRTGCGRHRFSRSLAPGETAQLMIIRPRRSGDDYSFRLSYDWKTGG